MIQLLKDRGSYRRLVHIGDGATDMEAWPPAVRDAVTRTVKPPPHVTNSSTNSSTNAFDVTMREFVDEFSELDMLTFDQLMRRILMRSTNFDDSFVAEFVDEFVTCGGGFSQRCPRRKGRGGPGHYFF